VCINNICVCLYCVIFFDTNHVFSLILTWHVPPMHEKDLEEKSQLRILF
jgi:hypothetical protein